MTTTNERLPKRLAVLDAGDQWPTTQGEYNTEGAREDTLSRTRAAAVVNTPARRWDRRHVPRSVR